MFLVTGPDLVIEACRAGIVGAFPTVNARTVEELDEWMQRITAALRQEAESRPGATIGPWAANLITHSTNLRLQQDLELVARYGRRWSSRRSAVPNLRSISCTGTAGS
jgi:nitronate monooxygenase